MALLVGLVVLVVAAARSRSPAGCASPPPVPELPAQLRALGDFDQPYPANETRTIQDAALKAASALHPDLAGAGATFVGDAVHVRAIPPATHDAEMIPLGIDIGPGGAPRRVAGVVAFLHDCASQLYFSAVEDLAAQPPPGFPSVDRATAAAQLGGDVELVYDRDPFHPVWRSPTSGRTLGAVNEPSLPPGFGGPSP